MFRLFGLGKSWKHKESIPGICTNCGHELRRDAEFCAWCGAATTLNPPNSDENVAFFRALDDAAEKRGAEEFSRAQMEFVEERKRAVAEHRTIGLDEGDIHFTLAEEMARRNSTYYASHHQLPTEEWFVTAQQAIQTVRERLRSDGVDARLREGGEDVEEAVAEEAIQELHSIRAIEWDAVFQEAERVAKEKLREAGVGDDEDELNAATARELGRIRTERKLALPTTDWVVPSS